jgi:hypothetical protein
MGGHRDNPAWIRSRLDTGIGWSDAVAAIGMPGCTFTICGTPETLAGQAGVADSVRGAMIYKRAAAEADQKIANTLDQRVERLAAMPATKATQHHQAPTLANPSPNSRNQHITRAATGDLGLIAFHL